MPTEITLDHNDTPQERAAKVWSAMGNTTNFASRPSRAASSVASYPPT